MSIRHPQRIGAFLLDVFQTENVEDVKDFFVTALISFILLAPISAPIYIINKLYNSYK